MSASITIRMPEWVDRVCVWPMIIYRQWKYGYTFRRIYLGEGIFAIVEPRDFRRVNYYHWSPRRNSNCIYAVRFVNGQGRKNKIVSMHRELMKAPRGKLVDHRNGLTLDNRRENLRLATHCENQFNKMKTSRKTSSRYIGVYREKRSGLWATKISSHGKSVWLGRFKTEAAAARAYDQAAIKYHGEFARLNFPNEKDISCIPPRCFLVPKMGLRKASRKQDTGGSAPQDGATDVGVSASML